ncbi:hypothetical protein Tco_0199734, partial [Tanacetum coccineum]
MMSPGDGSLEHGKNIFDMMKLSSLVDVETFIRLGLAADGFNPFDNLSQTYNMWPIILTTYNTPPWICMKETSLMLTMLIPGPRSPAKDIDVYLQPLIKELQELWKGVWTKDAATDTPAMAVKEQIAYVGHRIFLRTRHPQRSKFKEYYGSKEPTPKPRKFSDLEIQLHISKVLKRLPGKHPDIAKRTIKLIEKFNGIGVRQKVTADDNNITGMKSHDCHIMMHRLLPYGVQQYLPKSIAAPIIEFCLFFKQLCARTLMQQTCQNAKKQSIQDDVKTRFNHLGRNDDGLPEEEPYKFQVFRSICKPTGRIKETRLTTDVMQAVVCFVLKNSPEVDTDILAYR